MLGWGKNFPFALWRLTEKSMGEKQTSKGIYIYECTQPESRVNYPQPQWGAETYIHFPIGEGGDGKCRGFWWGAGNNYSGEWIDKRDRN